MLMARLTGIVQPKVESRVGEILEKRSSRPLLQQILLVEAYVGMWSMP